MGAAISGVMTFLVAAVEPVVLVQLRTVSRFPLRFLVLEWTISDGPWQR